MLINSWITQQMPYVLSANDSSFKNFPINNNFLLIQWNDCIGTLKYPAVMLFNCSDV